MIAAKGRLAGLLLPLAVLSLLALPVLAAQTPQDETSVSYDVCRVGKVPIRTAGGVVHLDSEVCFTVTYIEGQRPRVVLRSVYPSILDPTTIRELIGEAAAIVAEAATALHPSSTTSGKFVYVKGASPAVCKTIGRYEGVARLAGAEFQVKALFIEGEAGPILAKLEAEGGGTRVTATLTYLSGLEACGDPVLKGSTEALLAGLAILAIAGSGGAVYWRVKYFSAPRY